MIKLEEFAYTPGGICAAEGFFAYGVNCGLDENSDNPDVALVYSDVPCKAAVFSTLNKFRGASYSINKRALLAGDIQGILINSVSANCCDFLEDARVADSCVWASANALGIKKSQILNASVGSTGIPLDEAKITANLSNILDGISNVGGNLAAQVLNQGSSYKNQYAVKFKIGDKECTIGGMTSAGGGMDSNYAGNCIIITTDVSISAGFLSGALKYAAARTVMMSSLSPTPNDMVVLLSSKKAGNRIIAANTENYEIFTNALYLVMMNLVKQMIASSSGASKLIECMTVGAYDEVSAKAIAKEIVSSRSVMAALFDPRLKRNNLIYAIGGISSEYDRGESSLKISSEFGSFVLVENGEIMPFNEELTHDILSAHEIKILFTAGEGNYSAIAWGSDAI